MLATLPNAVSLARALLAFALFPLEDRPVWFLIVVSAAVVSDWLDGYLARKLNQTSRLGVVLDIVADNILRTALWMVVARMAPTAWLQCAAVLLVSVEWTTFFATQTLAGTHHWKDAAADAPKPIQAFFANGFRNPLAAWGMAGVFGLPVLCYIRFALPSLLPSPVLRGLAALLAGGRLLSLAVEAYFLWRYVLYLQRPTD
jgi:phosphatidylglycerophosphate synthase